MEFATRKPKQSPLETVNIFSRIFLLWVWPLFSLGSRQPLRKRDLWDPPDADKAKINADKLEKEWLKSLKAACLSKETPEIKNLIPKIHTHNYENHTEDREFAPLLETLISVFGKPYLTVWPMIVFNDCVLRVIQPWFMLRLIRTFIEDSTGNSTQYLYAAGVCLSTVLLTLTQNPSNFYLGRVAQRCRISLTSLIQRKVEPHKALRIRSAGGQPYTSQATTLITNDAGYLEFSLLNIPYVFVAPLQLFVFTCFLWHEFGISCLAGIGIIMLYVPFQYYYGNLYSLFRRKIGEKTDERTRMLSEILSGIESIKINAWEGIFESIVGNIRTTEVNVIKRKSSLHAINMSVFLTSSSIILFCTFCTFVYNGGHLTADRVIYAIAVYNTITHYIVFMLPTGVRASGEILGLLKRIQAFMLLEEQSKYSIAYKHDKDSIAQINLLHVSATWSNGTEPPFLSDVICELSHDKLVMIVGKFSAGKSSFLNLILNEINIRHGSVNVGGTLSYASQEPCIFPGTIRKNIIFHNKFDENRYSQVIEACGLRQDICQFQKGDLTNVEKLSQGQLTRVNLARALYHKADVYLLDDAFSAVDTKLSRHIFEKCIKEFLGKTLRVLVTDQLCYLKEADHIIIIDQGKIMAQGAYTELEQMLIKQMGLRNKNEPFDMDIPFSCTLPTTAGNIGANTHKYQVEDENDDEVVKTGSLGWNMYYKYFSYGSSWTQFCLFFFVFIIAQFFIILIAFWLATWANTEESRHSPDFIEAVDENNHPNRSENLLTNLNNLERSTYPIVYSVLLLFLFAANFAKSFAFFHFVISISRNIHRKMLESVLRAKTSFFYENNFGRIMNRFTKDIGIIDEQIPFTMFDMWTIFLQVITVIYLITSAMWYSVFAGVPFLLVLGHAHKYYTATSRELKRIDGATRSPVISHLQSTISGLRTVRALGAECAFSAEFDYLQDQNTSATISYLAASQFYNIWIEMLAVLLITVVTFGFILSQNCMTYLSGHVGIAIVSVISLTNWLQYGMKTWANVENLMISVERAQQYTKLIPEAPLESPVEHPFPAGWPNSGALDFHKVDLSYDGETDTLRQLSFSIKSNEKIGIIGKTSAGKSSIFRALFRLDEITNGSITFDNVSISRLGLHKLRQNLALVPQTQHFFQGTLAFNLDPLTQPLFDTKNYEHPDRLAKREQMNVILRLIGLKKDLDFKIETNGENCSLGERQLLLLARALLSNKRVICLDEATAHVDTGTDNRIQQVLRNQLQNSTVITIAHRLGTVIEYDKVLVLSNGQLVEFDHPHLLLMNPESQLSMMVNATGTDINLLKNRALKAWESRQLEQDLVDSIANSN